MSQMSSDIFVTRNCFLLLILLAIFVYFLYEICVYLFEIMCYNLEISLDIKYFYMAIDIRK